MIQLDLQPESEILRQRAAAYVRMSTEHQQYSTRNQLDVINGFAERRNLEVVKQYSDDGKSGLRIQGRAALSQMIGDVVTKKINYTHILVYDVSRWGRFQDPDEAAHYEFICREAGVAVHYCAEMFENDGTLTSTLAKNIKRAMAGEYSRELSTKTFQGACRMISLGFKQGGPSVYGMRRLLVDKNGQRKGMLQFGERKNLQNDRVIYVPGPAAEVKVVRAMFADYSSRKKNLKAIARSLNQRGIQPEPGRAWSMGKIRYLLKNEIYIGNLVYSRCSIKLKGRKIANPPDRWVRKDNAFEGLVSRELFDQAQEIFAENRQKNCISTEDMLASARRLFEEHGRLSSHLIKQLKQSPCAPTLQKRFGSLPNLYRLLGYTPELDFTHFEISRRLNQMHHQLMAEIIRQIEALGATATWNYQTHVLQINDELNVGVIFARHAATNSGVSRWMLRWESDRWETKPDLTVAVRMDRSNTGIHDYYLLPALQPHSKKPLRLTEQNGVYLDAYRFKTLDFLVGMAARVKFSYSL